MLKAGHFILIKCSMSQANVYHKGSKESVPQLKKESLTRYNFL